MRFCILWPSGLRQVEILLSFLTHQLSQQCRVFGMLVPISQMGNVETPGCGILPYTNATASEHEYFTPLIFPRCMACTLARCYVGCCLDGRGSEM